MKKRPRKVLSFTTNSALPRESWATLGPLGTGDALDQGLVDNPLQSEAQRGWMYANHPAMAKRWEAHTPAGPLPKRKRKKGKATHTSNARTKNLHRVDPSRTLMLRMGLVKELRRRFAILRGRLVKLIVTDDAFGLKDAELIANMFNPDQLRDEHGRWAASVSVKINTDTNYLSKFDVGGTTFGFQAVKENGNLGINWIVGFGLVDEKERLFEATPSKSDRSPFEVFAKVGAALHKFIEARRPERMEWSATMEEPARMRIYDRLSDRVAKEYGYDLRKRNSWGAWRIYAFDKKGHVANAGRVPLEMLKRADFVKLNVAGTNCSNCEYVKDGICQYHGEDANGSYVDLRGLEVDEHHCCARWDRPGTGRDFTLNAEFVEEQHPRDEKGEFTSGGDAKDTVKPPDKKESARVKALKEAAEHVQFTGRQMPDLHPEPVGRHDYDTIEERMTVDERSTMYKSLEQSRNEWVQDKVNDHEYDGPFATEEDVRGDLGEDATDEEVQQAMQEEDDRLRDNWERELYSSIEDDYDDYNKTEAHQDYLMDFLSSHDQEPRYSGKGSYGEVYDTWGLDGEQNWSYRFKTESGNAYNIWGIPSTVSDKDGDSHKVISVGFSDADERTKITGAGSAHEVFSKVVTAVAALIKHENPELVEFSAAEPSRIKLYSRLVRAAAAANPDYAAMKITPNLHPGAIDWGAEYFLYKRDHKETLDKKIAQVPHRYPPVQEVLVNAAGLYAECPDEWFTPEGWVENAAHDVSDETRDSHGRWEGEGESEDDTIHRTGKDWYTGEGNGEPQEFLKAATSVRALIARHVLGGEFHLETGENELYSYRVGVGNDRQITFTMNPDDSPPVVGVDFGYTDENDPTKTGKSLEHNTKEMADRLIKFAKGAHADGIRIYASPSDDRREKLYRRVLKRAGLKESEHVEYLWNLLATVNYSPDQPRDAQGHWTKGDTTQQPKATGPLAFLEHIPAAIADHVRAQVQTKYAALSNRYGPGYAKAIIASALVGLPIPLPGASLATASVALAAAELHRLAVGGPKKEPTSNAGNPNHDERGRFSSGDGDNETPLPSRSKVFSPKFNAIIDSAYLEAERNKGILGKIVDGGTVRDALAPEVVARLHPGVLNTPIKIASNVNGEYLSGFATGKDSSGQHVIVINPQQPEAEYAVGLLHEIAHIEDQISGRVLKKQGTLTELHADKHAYRKYKRSTDEKRAEKRARDVLVKAFPTQNAEPEAMTEDEVQAAGQQLRVELEQQFAGVQGQLPPTFNEEQHQPTLAVDFDGRIAENDPSGHHLPLDETKPRPGTRTAMEYFRDCGLKVIVWTARGGKEEPEVKAWLKKYRIPYDEFNENPGEEHGSRKIIADLYLDDRGEGDPDEPWSDLVKLVDRRFGLGKDKVRQPEVKRRALYNRVEGAQGELKELLGKAGVPIYPYDEIKVGAVEALCVSGPPRFAILAPVKGMDRANEKVDNDYGGDWSKLVDVVRATLAAKTLGDLKKLKAKFEKVAGKPLRCKDRFAQPVANGYRDIMCNYRLPGGLVCEVQYHLTSILAARERQHVAYEAVRTIKANMKEEGRRKMTQAEKAVVRQQKDYGVKLLASAWDECKANDPTLNAVEDEARDDHGRWTAGGGLQEPHNYYVEHPNGNTTKIMINPSAEDVVIAAQSAAKEQEGVRGFADDKGNVYIWSNVNDLEHFDVMRKLKIAEKDYSRFYGKWDRVKQEFRAKTYKNDDLDGAKYVQDWGKKHNILITNAGKFEFESNAESLDEFQKWLEGQFGELFTGKDVEVLWHYYAQKGYEKGAGRAWDDVNKGRLAAALGKDNQLDFLAGGREEFLRSAFGQPETTDKLKLLASRSFMDLKNVTHDMATRMRRELTDGLSQGAGPYIIADRLAKELDIGQNRADVIARTEIVRAHAEGQLGAMEDLGVDSVGVEVEFSTAGDDRVCEDCASMEGTVMPIAEAHGVIPVHPQCRCAWLPANVGESKAGQKQSPTTNEWDESQHPRDEKGEFSSSGAAPGERTITDDQVRKRVREFHAAKELIGQFNSGVDQIDVSKMPPADRIAFLQEDRRINEPGQRVFVSPQRFAFSKSDYSKRWEQFSEDAKKGNWSGEKILKEGYARGIFQDTPFEGDKSEQYRIGNSYSLDQGSLVRGLSPTQKVEFAAGYAAMPGKASQGPGLRDFHDAGWTKAEMEMFADKLQEKGWRADKWAAEGEEARKNPDGSTAYDQRDQVAGNLAWYSKDYDNFRASLYSGWAIMHGTQDAVTAREVAGKIWPCSHSAGCYELTKEDAGGREIIKGAYSDRAVENMKKLKAETEAYYKAKLKTHDLQSKPLEVMRAVGGHPEAYVPGAIESWTRDAKTVPRFGKLMATGDRRTKLWSALKTTLTYDDVLWSYEVAKGKPGWPEEKELKGKKEFVTLGRGIGKVEVEHNTTER